MTQVGTRESPSDFPGLGGGGCITIATGLTTVNLLNAFGADRLPLSTESADVRPGGLVVYIRELTNAIVAVERGGFVGAEESVLRAASTAGLASSLYWDQKGMTLFSAARRGRIVCIADLAIDAELANVPRSALKRLPPVDSFADPIALGFALMEAFTNVRIAPFNIDTFGNAYAIPEPPDDFHAQQPGWSSLKYHAPKLLELIKVSPYDRLRAATAWAALQTAHCTDLDKERAVAEALADYAVRQPIQIGADFLRLERDARILFGRLWAGVEGLDGRRYAPTPEMRAAEARLAALRGLRHLGVSDPVSAALGTIEASIRATPNGQHTVPATITSLLTGA